MTAKHIGSLGLILDIIGICILFKYGFPQPDLDDDVKLAWGKDPDAARKRKLYVAMSIAGLLFLIAGFALQLTAVWM